MLVTQMKFILCKLDTQSHEDNYRISNASASYGDPKRGEIKKEKMLKNKLQRVEKTKKKH